ncbi:MAG: HAMP domain-containing histidine kinase [Lachnospiraceae bacterium]|nr:HAMP domain-containing histidine kinase [Lachnospiraceae bacterium]
MRNYNKLVMVSLVIYAVLAVSAAVALRTRQDEKGQFYKVEMNRIIAKIEQGDAMDALDLRAYQDIRAVAYLPVSETDRGKVMDFYRGRNGMQSAVYPIYANDSHDSASSEGEQIAGYLRFDYQRSVPGGQYLFATQGALLLMELFLQCVLFYLKRHLIQPFDRMQSITYELSKGNLQGDVRAEKNQYLGKFLWGLSELKDALHVSRKREMELQREKKMLLLSLSHDIKTPLSMIKLYAKALGDGIYPTADERQNVYRQIGEKAVQIEDFVGEIVKASREDIVRIEVQKGEFYLRELVRRVESVYGDKCALRKCALTVGTYQNRIFQGDLNRLLEVFENLFENAFKYGDGRKIQISFYEEDYCQLIRVFNTGEPVTEKDFVHLFDSFFRGENTRGQQGNGLGLYICKEIMRKMGGEIFAGCETDGMAFVVVLPL